MKPLSPTTLSSRPFSAAVAALLTLTITLAQAQLPSPPPTSQPATTTTQAQQPRNSDRRRAAKLYLAASKLFMDERFEDAMQSYKQAAALDPANTNYRLAIDVARAHAVTALIQSAAKARLRGDTASTRAALTRALQLDPQSIEATQHMYELGDDAARQQSKPLYAEQAVTPGEPVQLQPTAGLHSFHLRAGQLQIVQQVFKAYGISVSADDSLQSLPARLDIDDASFAEAMRAVALVTNTFYVPLDAHHVLVAHDTRANRQQFTPLQMETIYLSGLKPDEITEIGTLARQVFNMQQVTPDPGAGTLTIRASADAVTAFNTTIRQLLDGHSQVLLDVKLIQLGHSNTRNTGVTPPQSFTAYNLYAEEQSILTANKTLVDQIISEGLASAGDTLAILGILIASGEVSSSLFSNGLATFGGGITQSALAPSAAKLNLNLNSSVSRQLDQIQLRLGDGEAGTLKLGERYPIQTSSFSSLSSTSSTIAGLTGAGTSSALSSLLASLENSVPSVPQVEYQDLGMTLKATANVMRNSDVALTLDLKITALSGSEINGNPILNNRAYSGVVTIRQGEAVMVASELDKSESRNISGMPGLSEIPGLNDVTNKDAEKNYATLLIIITPHVIRGAQSSGHSPMLRIEKSTATQ